MTFFKESRSLRTKFLVTFGALSVLALSLTVVIASWKAREALEEQIRAHILSTVKEYGRGLQDELEMKWRWLNSKSDTAFIVEGLSGRSELAGHLAVYMRQLNPAGRVGRAVPLYLYDSGGRLAAENGAEGYVPSDLGNTAWFRDVIAHGNPKAELLSRGDGRVLLFAAPVFRGEKVAGALVAVFWLDFMRDILLSEKAFNASLLTSDGGVIMGDLTEADGKRLAGLPVDPEDPKIFAQDGTLYAIGVLNAPLEAGDEYLLVLSAPLGEVYAPVASLSWYILGAGLLVAMAMAALIFWLSGELLAPLNGLKAAMQLIVSGAEISMRVRVRGNDEIGSLSATFNKMMDALAEKTRQLESSLERSAQAEKMGAVGQLAAGVAHEINNPLGIILGFAQGLVKRLKEGDPMSLPLKSIERETLRCKNLVQDLLVFSRTSKIEEEPVDLNEVVGGTLSLIAARARAHAVEIARDLAPDLPRVPANKNKLQQVLINLANNAIDAMPKGGTLSIATSVSASRPGYVELRVADNGHGIPENIRHRIMEPFFTTKEAGKGTGLGLALVYEIIKKHNGSLELTSQEGKGTTFAVYLPVRTPGPGEGI